MLLNIWELSDAYLAQEDYHLRDVDIVILGYDVTKGEGTLKELDKYFAIVLLSSSQTLN